MKMTESQSKAIFTSGKNVLVSASAGAGKTFIMIERIIRLILEENVDVSNVLAVTYTKLAASEMKQKLVKAVIKRINEGKDVERMRKTLAEIPTADISTIHSFCLNLLKSYFYSANIDPNFSILEGPKGSELSSLALKETFSELYEKGDENFLKLVRILRKSRGDEELKKNVLELYKKSVSQSDPIAYLDGCAHTISVENYEFYENFLLETYKKQLALEEKRYNLLKASLSDFANDKLAKDLTLVLDDVWVKVLLCLKATTLQEFLKMTKTSTLSMPKTKSDDEALMQLKEEISEFKSNVSDIFKKTTKDIPEDRDDDLRRFLETKPMVEAIIDIVKLYSNKFSSLKTKEVALDFSDLEHKTLELLKNNPDVLSAVKEKYKYIFADEYQDVNGVQEELLTLISNNNLFMVGDVKQSIYAFRGCNPDILASKFDSYQKDNSLGEPIALDQNFRSADKVLDAVNNVFSSVITKEHGGLDYSSNPMQGGVLYEKGYGNAFLHVIKTEKEEKQPIDRLYDLVEDATTNEKQVEFYEGALVSKIILEELSKTIYDEKEKKERPVTLGDITILTRNSSGYTDDIIEHLVREGIPVVSESKVNILNYPEIKLLTDILKLIVFYADDPPLTSVLKSAVGKLCEEDLAKIRAFSLKNTALGKSPSFLTCVEAYSLNGDNQELKTKLITFKDYFDKIRILSEFLGAGEILSKIMRETGLDLEIAGRTLGKNRLARIERFISESTSNGKELSCGEFLDKINSAESFNATSEVAGTNAVKVMSMHSSKGLEFPIVIIPGLHKQFNAQDDSQEILFSRKHGIAVYHYDEKNKLRTSTLARTFFKKVASLERANEEARVFYVAMTRAKIRLHLVSTAKIKSTREEGDYLSTTHMCDFLSLKDMPVKNYEQSEFSFLENDLVKTVELNDGNALLIDEIYKNLTFEYPFEKDVGLPLKASVTSVNARHRELEEKTFAHDHKKPHFVGEEDLLAKGTAYHKFLEVCDFKEKNGDNQLIRLLSEGKLQKEDAKHIDSKLLDKILSLPLWNTLNGYKLYREQPFLANFTARELYGDDSDAPILVQGIIDLIAVCEDKAILVDYKTSSHSAQRLKQDYFMQLSLYKKAIEKCLNLTVSKTYILSLITGELIEM